MPAVATAAGLPSRLGKYELLMPLAAGGMARIYIGRSTGIGSFERHVVLKMITPERANDLTAVNMFLDEARLAASLNHQNVAQVFEVGEDVGIHYLAMEYVHGQDLRAVLAKAGSQGTRIPLELALTVVAGAAAGLNHAHERRGPDGQPLGIVHRDVSPSNIMIGYDGAVKLLDFGIAKATMRSVETQSGIIKGKFAYMAPEQCRGRDVDRRSDVFSLGIILYEISTQHRCFRADSDFDTMHRIVTGDVVRPTRLVQVYPQALEAIVMKALATDSTQRYQSAGLLLEAIESFAVSSRMSLSTMGLGRFMRDMFGEVQEPWLNTAATKVLQPIVAKETTISSTDGKGSQSSPELNRDDINESGIPDDEAAFPDSAKAEAAKTILDLPRDPREREREQEQEQVPADWNAKSYPASQPSIASASTIPPEAHMRPSYPQGLGAPPGMSRDLKGGEGGPATIVDEQPMTGGPAGTSPPPYQGYNGPPTLPLPPPPHQFNTPGSGSHPHAHFTPQGSGQHGPYNTPQSVPVPQSAFATPGSGSGPAIPQPGQIVSTKHGYASAAMTRGDVSYPRFEVPMDGLPPDVQLTPNRRPLFIGLGIVLAGLIIILIMAFSGGEEESAATPEDETEEPADETKAMTSEQTPPAPGSDQEVLDENMVSIVIHSDPPGADVLIAGSKIGTTPFESKLKRGTKMQQLTVQKAGYAPFTKKIDLGAEYENRNIKLLTLEEAAEAEAEAEGAKSGTEKSGTEKSGTEKSGVEKSGTEKSGIEKSATEKSGTTEKAGTGATEKTGTSGTTEKSGASTKTGSTEKSGTTEKTGTTEKSGTTTKTGSTATTKTGTSGTSTTGTTKTGTEKTGTTTTKTGTGTPTPKKEKCQPPGPNVDPFGPPICKT